MPSAKRMIQAVREFPKPVHCIVENRAFSAAFWLLQTCDKRIALSTAELMAHEPLFMPTYRSFTRSTLQDMLGELNVLNDVIAETVAPRMGMTIRAYKRRIAKGDWHMSARGALKNRAVDRVIPNIKSYHKKLKQLYSVDRH